jgi:hypothetical protein
MLRHKFSRWRRRSAGRGRKQVVLPDRPPSFTHPRIGETAANASPAVSAADDTSSPPAFGTALPQALRLVSTVVAPTTLVTGLAIYFGRMHATGYFRYFGVNYTVFDMTVQDYLVRAADGMFVPLAAAAGTVLLAVWCHLLVAGALPSRTRRRVVKVLLPLSAATGLFLIFQAFNEERHEWPLYGRYPELGGLSLAAGALLLIYAAHLVRLLPGPHPLAPRSPSLGGVAVAEWAAAFVLVSAGLFWAVNAYAQGVGWGRGQQQADQLAASRDVVVYSRQLLNVTAEGVRETICTNPEPGYRYRYDGLKVGLKLGGQLFFLPASWTPSQGAALVIPSTDDIRLEFSRAGQSVPSGC